jgi:3',5'-cyclic-AMP phosphodiesterase
MTIKEHESRRRTELLNRYRTHVPPLPPSDGPPRAPRRLAVFATGPTWCQLTWSRLGPGPVRIRAGDAEVHVDADGGPGAALVEGLAPDIACSLVLDGAGVPGAPVALTARTLPVPPGALVHRIATVNDTHIGSDSTGYFHTIVEKPEPDEPHPARCARAALREAGGWGAAELVVKGDLVDHSHSRWWADAADVLAELDVPTSIVPGNHEWSGRGDCDPRDGLAAQGLHLVSGVEHRDRPGIRLLLVDSSIPGADPGRLSGVLDEVVALAGDAAATGTPVLVAMHHQPTRFRFPTYLPAGVPGPDAHRFLRALGRANPHALVTSGHTHRHRRRHLGPVTITEVGSTKDFPGTWAGYEVYEGGIVQTVRRVAEPSCIRWTDHTRRAALGVWQLWSPGRLSDRCFTRTW